MFLEYEIDRNIKRDCFTTSPTVIRVNSFDEDAGQKFYESFQKALNSDMGIIPIIIDSYGGSVYGLLGMLDCIRASHVPVATYIGGKAMSAGAVLFTAGTEGYRFMAPGAHIMIHQVSSGSFGKVEDMVISTEQAVKLNKQLLETLSKNIGKPSSFFADAIKKNGGGDLYYTAKEAAKLNITNHVKTPRLVVRVKQEFEVQTRV